MSDDRRPTRTVRYDGQALDLVWRELRALDGTNKDAGPALQRCLDLHREMGLSPAWIPGSDFALKTAIEFPLERSS